MEKSVLPHLVSVLILTSFVNVSSAQKILIKQTRMHPFSDPVKPDKFTLSIKGESILKGKVTFNIVNFDGRQIFKRTYSSEDLLGDWGEVLTAQQKIDTLKSRVHHFFEERNFVKPAIGPTEKYDANDGDPKVSKDIKDERAIGFLYSMYYESTFGIAWSKRQHKVVQYFYSD